MIKNIYLHIGLHKTGTSTIQHILGKQRNDLAAEGILYPIIPGSDKLASNHSVPFFSMFSSRPERYHINILNGHTTSESIKKLNEDYYNQLQQQISGFAGESMIISGEDISYLNDKELLNLKRQLVLLTCDEVQFTVIAFIRHPVELYRSRYLEKIKTGHDPKKVLDYPIEAEWKANEETFDRFMATFGQESFICRRFEDLLRKNDNLTVSFLKLIGYNGKLENFAAHDKTVVNKSLSYEPIILLTQIHQKYPKIQRGHLNPMLEGFRPALIYSLPGVKFYFSEPKKLDLWNRSKETAHKICERFQLAKYDFKEISIIDDSKKWDVRTLQHLIRVFPQLPDFIVAIIVDTVLVEFARLNKFFSIKKKLLIYAFLMFHSEYFNQNSKLRKMMFFNQQLGLRLNLYLAVLYKLFQPKLQASLTGKPTE
jgi:hypothetical protein